MRERRYGHAAVRLPNGKVLVLGGPGTSQAEVYDPTSGSFTPTGAPSVGRTSFTATLLASGKVLVGNLSVGKLGADASHLLGSLLLSQLEVAALSRSRLPESKRRPFLVFVDEAHTMRLIDASQIRKYGLAMVIATQRASSLDPEDRANILSNTGTLIVFRLGPEDARLLESEFLPEFNQHDLVNLERYAIRLKLMIDGVVSRPFSARTLPPPEGSSSVRQRIIAFSRTRYGR